MGSHFIQFVVCVDYDEKDTAKDLGCYWSMENRRWQKDFDSRHFKGSIQDFKRVVDRFLKRCEAHSMHVMESEGLEELEEALEIPVECLIKE